MGAVQWQGRETTLLRLLPRDWSHQHFKVPYLSVVYRRRRRLCKFRLFSLIQGPSMSPREKEGSGIPRTHNNFTSFHRSTRDDDDEAKPTFCHQEHSPPSSSLSQSIFVSSN